MANMDDLLGSLDDQAEQKKSQADKAAGSAEAAQNTDKIVGAVDKATQATSEGLKSVKGEVKVTNPTDVSGVVESINKLNLTTFMQNEGLPQLAKNLNDLSGKTQDLQNKLENEGLKKMSDQLGLVVKKLDEVSKTLSKTEVSVDVKLQKTIDNLSKSIGAINFKPSVNVSAPQPKVVATPVDFKPVLSALAGVEQAIKDSEIPETKVDLSAVTSGLSAVQKAITSLRFPVPNYVLPFQDSNGKAAQARLDNNNNLLVNLGAERAQLANLQTSISSSTAETTIINADATYKQDLYGLILTNTSATVTKVTIKDSTAGTTRMVFEVPATDTRGFMLPTEAGHKQAAVNTSWTATCGTSVATLEVTALVVKNL